MTDQNGRRVSRREAVGSGVAMLGAAVLSPPVQAAGDSTPAGVHAFAFLNGDWHVRHRKLTHRLASAASWYEFDGTCRAWEILDGAGNVDDNVLHDPKGTYRAATMRMLDPSSGIWSIWWFDPRVAELGPPVRGRFHGDQGTFLGNDQLDGRAILVRFQWTIQSPRQALWEQAFSSDDGARWETNWIMRFEKVPA